VSSGWDGRPLRNYRRSLVVAIRTAQWAGDDEEVIEMVFDEGTRTLLDGKNFAVAATLNADGGPQTSVVWFKRDGDSLVFTTTAQRQKGRNLARDPRISMSIYERDNPYNTVEVRGSVQLVEDEHNSLGTELSRKYLGEDPPPDPDGTVRLIVRVIPEKVTRLSL
jgi:PPOX class probable F420-dependent enzyme